MQMAMVGAGVANDGVVMKPYLVAEEQAPDLSALSITEPEPLSRAVSSEVAAELRDMMVTVVTNGTGAARRSPESAWAARPALPRTAIVHHTCGSWPSRLRKIRRWRWQ